MPAPSATAEAPVTGPERYGCRLRLGRSLVYVLQSGYEVFGVDSHDVELRGGRAHRTSGPLRMPGGPRSTLKEVVTAFRSAIERSRAEKASPHLPYFPEGACRIVSRLLAVHLNRRGYEDIRYCTGHLPGFDESVRHAWLVVDGTIVDLAADPFGQLPVVVTATSAFHDSLESVEAADAATVLATVPPDAAARDERLLSQIEIRLALPS